jgi:hypothetical protein
MLELEQRRLADGCARELVVAVSGRRSPVSLKFFALLALLVSMPALAEKGEAKVVQEADKVVVRKRTVIDFNDVTVEGELTKPEGSYLLNRNKTRFQSLIKLRDNFNPELQKSADNL